MAGRIGAQHGDVESSAGTFDLAGQTASLTGADATAYAGEMEAGVDQLMALLSTHFQEMAEDLRQRVADHKARLAATDWEGASKENAQAAEELLNAEVDRVLNDALEQVEAFGTSMHARAESFRGVIEGEFMAAMQAADADYQQLATAARRFVSNLQQADQTIRLA